MTTEHAFAYGPDNRSMPLATVIPVLHYPDVPAAVAWLCGVFGLTERLRIGTHRVQLNAGHGAVVIAAGEASSSGLAGHAVMVRVSNVDQHYARVAGAGAVVLGKPASFPYGERQYSVRDPSGRLWTFSQSEANVEPSLWGGQLLAASAAPVEVVREFWRLMATNDFHAVNAVLAPEFVLEWPQSRERIRGADRFARMNAEYPAHGRWQFTVHRITGDDREAVSDVGVTDGVQVARAISFFTIAQGQVTRLLEFWPEPFEAPRNRAHLVEPMP